MPERITSYRRFLTNILARLDQAKPPFKIGIAGTPATGKSTLAERLVSSLSSMNHTSRLCPMDGFHLRNSQLDARGLRRFKGRCDTFDSSAFAEAVKRLGTGISFWWPSYSRQLHEPVPEGIRIEGTEDVYVIEGNYVLADSEPWRTSAEQFDLRVFVDAPNRILRHRLLRRHTRGGCSRSEAFEKISRTDMLNASVIRTKRLAEDILYLENGNA